MGRKRRVFSDKFKAAVAVEALGGAKTVAQLAADHGVHPNQVGEWKRRLITGAPELFAPGASRPDKTEEELTAPLYEQIGRLEMDLRWLKKKL